MRVEAPEIIKAVELASDLRERMGKRKLKDLPKGRKLSGRHCILARAFNFDCSVQLWDGGWAVFFPMTGMTPTQLAALKAWADANQLRTIAPGVFTLPKDVGDIAHRFDCGRLPMYESK